MYSVEEDEGFNKYKPKWQRLVENDYVLDCYLVSGHVNAHNQNPDNKRYIPPEPVKKPSYKMYDRPPIKKMPVRKIEKTTPSISQRILWINDKYEVEKQRLASIARDMIELEPNRRDQIISDLGYKLMDMTSSKDKKLQKLYDIQNKYEDDDW